MSWLALCCGWRWRASAIPFDYTTERWSDCFPRPLGARRVDRGVTERASAPTHRTRQCTEPAPRIQRHSTLHQSCFPPLKADCRLRYRFVVGQKYSRPLRRWIGWRGTSRPTSGNAQTPKPPGAAATTHSFKHAPRHAARRPAARAVLARIWDFWFQAW